MNTRDRLLLVLLGCHSLDLDHLAHLWERYALDIDLEEYLREFGSKSVVMAEYRFVMLVTLEQIARKFLEQHGLPEDEPRDEHNNFMASAVVFHDPEVQARFEAWRPRC